MYYRGLHYERFSWLHNVQSHFIPTDESLAIKAITLPLAIASGLSVGKEGPSVHVAVCAGHTISRLFKISKSAIEMREIYAASSAAGVAVAFGSPVGGVLFSLEEMVSFGGNVGAGTIIKGFLMALVACMAVRGLDPFRTGGLVMFEVRYERDWQFFEVPLVATTLSNLDHLFRSFGDLWRIIWCICDSFQSSCSSFSKKVSFAIPNYRGRRACYTDSNNMLLECLVTNRYDRRNGTAI
jgi:Voltage gated chloride channel